MSKSAVIRSQDWHAILQLVGECRDLGDDRNLWRIHFIGHLAKLVDADVGFCGELAGLRVAKPLSLGVTDWGWDGGLDRTVLIKSMDVLGGEPSFYGTALCYFERVIRNDGVCHSRRELTEDRDWYRSKDYQFVQRPCGLDHQVQCCRLIPGAGGDEFSGLVLNRVLGRREFNLRDVALVREAHAALGPLIGGPLARYSEPTPRDLSPRVRQVLACLLEGESDKLIAVRLRLSKFTVNQYAKLIFHHFGVNSRPELLARWIRRGWGNRFPWVS